MLSYIYTHISNLHNILASLVLVPHFIDEKIKFKEAYKQMALFYSKTMFFLVFPASILDPKWWVYDYFDSTPSSTLGFKTVLFIPLD